MIGRDLDGLGSTEGGNLSEKLILPAALGKSKADIGAESGGPRGNTRFTDVGRRECHTPQEQIA